MENGEAYAPLPSEEPPLEALLGSEEHSYDAYSNLDQFFTRLYRYWEEKGLVVIITARVLNLLALGFTIAMSAALLLGVNWYALLHAPCLRADQCDIWDVAIRHPFTGGFSIFTALSVVYLLVLCAFWLFALMHLLYEVHELKEVRSFFNNKLGMSERTLSTSSWPDVAKRIVTAQQAEVRLCAAKDLTEHDIVSRIMRKENYLLGMLNKGILALHLPFNIPGIRQQQLLWNQTLEWNLYWCLFDQMFDRHFRLRASFVYDERALRRRFKYAAVANVLAAPFILAFLLTYFFLKNAERFYHHPSTVGARRWSPLARWKLREFNELPHFLNKRLDGSQLAAQKYISQFPSPIVAHIARFMAFVAGSFAALLLFATAMDERLLERDLGGRQIVWWVAVTGIILAISRAFIEEPGASVFDPELAMMEVVAQTHYLPRHWRGRAHTGEVQAQFESLFQYKATLFFQELTAVVMTPILLWSAMPQRAHDILSFVQSNTSTVEGVGDICSLAAFDFQKHGNAKYGAPVDAPQNLRSRQGKMEKSFITFAATYPSWAPDVTGRALLKGIGLDEETGLPGIDDTARFNATLGLLAMQYPHLNRLYHDRDQGAGYTGSMVNSQEYTFVPADDRVRSSQLLLQSYYEDRTHRVERPTPSCAPQCMLLKQPPKWSSSRCELSVLQRRDAVL